MNIKKGPWTVVDSKNVYSNRWINVKEDKVIQPDGKDGIFGVITMKPGVSIIPIDDQGYVYLTEEYHYAVERETMEAISGGINNNESKLEAAKRELLEEAGIQAKEWVDMGVVDPFTSVINSPNSLYLAKNLSFSKANHDGTEKIKIIKVSFNKAVDWVMQGVITHSATVALILKINILFM